MFIQMTQFKNHRTISNLFHSLSLVVLIIGAFLTNGALASSIERYDFDDSSLKISKYWDKDVALFVAKKFAKDNGFDENTVSVAALKAGATNNFIYLVNIENQLKFVIKGFSSKQEAEALSALQHHAKIKDAENNPAAAKVCQSKMVNYYIAQDDKRTYYFALLEAAQGKDLFKFMRSELLESKNVNQLKDAFYSIGVQLSEFHKSIVGADNIITPQNISTIIHDDLHPENAFFNQATNSFSLIDTESMGESITHPLPIVRELYGLYEIPIIRWPAEKITIDLLQDADPHDIASIYIELINGMASVYKNSNDAKLVFGRTIVKLNNMSMAFLKDNTSEYWMLHPSDKSEIHIVWGKLAHAIYNSKLKNIYLNNLALINNDLEIYLKQINQ